MVTIEKLYEDIIDDIDISTYTAIYNKLNDVNLLLKDGEEFPDYHEVIKRCKDVAYSDYLDGLNETTDIKTVIKELTTLDNIKDFKDIIKYNRTIMKDISIEDIVKSIMFSAKYKAFSDYNNKCSCCNYEFNVSYLVGLFLWYLKKIGHIETIDDFID